MYVCLALICMYVCMYVYMPQYSVLDITPSLVYLPTERSHAPQYMYVVLNFAK